MSGLIFVLIAIATFWALAYFAAPLWLWTTAAALGLIADGWQNHTAPVVAWVIFLVLAVALNVHPLRRMLVTNQLLGWFRKVLPPSPRLSASPSMPATLGGMRTCSRAAPTGRSSWPHRPPC